MEEKTFDQVIQYLLRGLKNKYTRYDMLSKDDVRILLCGIEELQLEIEKLELILDWRDYEDNKRPTPSLQ